jgi:hypothetical protein
MPTNTTELLVRSQKKKTLERRQDHENSARLVLHEVGNLEHEIFSLRRKTLFNVPSEAVTL